jgi:hypothetical protein
MEPDTLRALERILAVGIGGLSIYLGYCLFLHIPDQRDSEGRVRLPGGISIFLSRVGPGAFFALFGAFVVGLSFYYSVAYSKSAYTRSTVGDASRPQSKGGEAMQATDYSGLGSRMTSTGDESLRLDRIQAGDDRAFLANTLPSLLRPDLSAERRNDMDAHTRRLDLALIRMAWGPDWGSFEEFRRWVENGAVDPPPKGLGAAAAFYRRGKEVRK